MNVKRSEVHAHNQLFLWHHHCAVLPHIHAITQDFDAPFLIATGEIMEGDFPPKAKAMVKELILKYQNELLTMWATEQYQKLPPLDYVRLPMI